MDEIINEALEAIFMFIEHASLSVQYRFHVIVHKIF